MMKTLILSAPPLLAALTVAAFLPAATARAGLIVRMDFNDADGAATLVNAGSEPVTATLHNVTLEPVSPPVNRSGYSARFNQPVYSGTNYVSLGDINALDGLTQLTIAAWVKEEESKGSIRMISKGSAAWDLQLSDNTPAVCIESVTRYSTQALGRLWKYLVMTYDGNLTTNNVVFFYGDGVTLAPFHTNTIDRGSISANSLPVWFGDFPNTGGGRSFKGWMDNVRIYDEVVSLSELETAMKSDDSPDGPPPEPFVRLDFNDRFGEPSLANRGTLAVTGTFHGVNAAYHSETPPPNRAAADGRSGSFAFVANTTEDRNYVDLGDVNDLDSLQLLTVCTWLKGIGTQGNSVTRLACKGSGFEFSVAMNNNTLQTARPELKIDSALTDGHIIPISNDWIFVAATFDGRYGADNVVFYHGTGSVLTAGSTNTIARTGTPASGTSLFVGDWNLSDGSRGFSGLLDNFRIYNRILDEQELRNVMLTDDSEASRGTNIRIH